MLTKEQMMCMTTYGPKDIQRFLIQSGYACSGFNDARFLGLTESGHFCYEVEYYDESGTGEDTARVYLRVKVSGWVTAEF